MANDIVRFSTGLDSNINKASNPKQKGKVMFAVTEGNRGYIYFDKDNNTRIKMSALIAEQDSLGQSITDTYLANIKQNESTINTFSIASNNAANINGTKDIVTIPNASTTLAGLITGEAQTLGGAKTFNDAVTINDKLTVNEDIVSLTGEPYIAKKEFNNVLCTANNDPNGYLYYGQLKLKDYHTEWYFKAYISVDIPYNSSRANTDKSSYEGIVEFWGYGSTITAYRNFNAHAHTSYRTLYHHNVYRATQAGCQAYGHLMGIRFYSSWNPATAGYERNIKIKVIHTDNCTFSFFDNMTLYANAPGTGSTNYVGKNDYEGAANGLQETADNNTIDRVYAATVLKSGAGPVYRYSLIMRDNTGGFSSISRRVSSPNSNDINNATIRHEALTDIHFDPNYPVLLYNSGSTQITAAATTATVNNLYTGIPLDTRYITKCNITSGYVENNLVSGELVYLIFNKNNDGTISIDENIATQELPTSENGKVYMLWGIAYSTYQLYMWHIHPMLEYIEGKIRPYYPDPLPVKQGGTGKTVWTANRLIYTSAANALSELAAGTDGQILISKGNNVPQWASPSSLTIGKASQLETARNFSVSDNDKTNRGSGEVFNGTQDVELCLPADIKFSNITATSNITVNTGNIDIVNVLETDKYLGFYYNANKTAGASWRIGHKGSGSGDTNYFVLQSGTSATSATTWNDVVRFGMNSFDTWFKGNVNPQETNTKTLGTSSLKWSTVYATSFNSAAENMYITSDSNIYIEANAGTSANKIGFAVNTTGDIVPVKAEVMLNGETNIGTLGKEWKNVFAKRFSGLAGGVDYLECSTAAATAAKVVSLEDYVLNTGSSIYIKFTNQNTADAPTLNINGTGAKSIYYKNTRVLDNGLTNNIIYHMIYDGTNWVIVNDIDDTIPSGSSSTGASTSAKVASINGFIAYPGAKVDIIFTAQNSVTSPTLNINTYGAKNIMYKGTRVGSTALGKDILYHLEYNGTQFNVLDFETPVVSCTTAIGTAAKTATVPGYVNLAGEKIKLIFANGNTAASPTLNINSNGAKQIYYKGVRVTGAAIIAGYEYELEYDGTYWQIKNENIPIKLAKCTTGASTAAKVVSCGGYVPFDGATIEIYFSTTNSAQNPTLNINGYGAKPIWINSSDTGGNGYKFRGERTYRFIYDATYNNNTGTYRVIDDIFQHDAIKGRTAHDAVTDPNTGKVTTPAITAITGYEYLYLGNELTSNTDGGMTGCLGLYGSSSYYQRLLPQPNGGNRDVYLPNYAGSSYLIHGGNNNAIGGTSQPVYIAANGRATAITYTANRLYYPSSTTAFTGGTHYVNGTKIAINSTSEPSYNFYVNGTSYLKGTTVIEGTTKITGLTASQAVVTNASNELTSRAITNNTSATAVSQTTNLITENTLYYHKGNSNIITVGTITSGTWNGTVVATTYGGTGLSSFTANRLYYPSSTSALSAGTHYVDNTHIAINSTTVPSYNLYVNGSSYFYSTASFNGTIATTLAANSAVVTDGSKNLAARSITNNTTATAVTASTNLITANTLYYHKGNSNIVTVGTITSGTWNGTAITSAYGGTGVTGFTANRLCYATSTTELAFSHYASDTKVAINSTTAPSYNFYVSGTSYFSGNTIINGTGTVNGAFTASSTATITGALTASSTSTFTGKATFNGGVNVSTLTGSYAVVTDSSKNLTSKAISDSSSAGALSSTSTKFVTERDIYYGLPSINNGHAYTSSTSIYAPTAGGSANYVLAGAGSTAAPAWRSTLQVPSAGTILATLPINVGANASSGARTVIQDTGGIDIYNATEPFINFHPANSSTAKAQVIAEDDCIKFVFN